MDPVPQLIYDLSNDKTLTPTTVLQVLALFGGELSVLQAISEDDPDKGLLLDAMCKDLFQGLGVTQLRNIFAHRNWKYNPTPYSQSFSFTVQCKGGPCPVDKPVEQFCLVLWEIQDWKKSSEKVKQFLHFKMPYFCTSAIKLLLYFQFLQ